MVKAGYIKALVAVALFLLGLSAPAWAGEEIPATPVMTLYKFNGSLDVPYYTVESVAGGRKPRPAGYLAQGSSVIPCLVIVDGRPLTDKDGTPYVGFEILVNSRKATRESTSNFEAVVAQRKAMRVPNHHCRPGMKHVMNVRRMYDLEKEPFFDPAPTRSPKFKPKTGRNAGPGDIVRAFHNSPQCAEANRSLIGRRGALASAWERFIAANSGRWDGGKLERAKHLDYVMRTALYEGHLDRGCSAYGACERNIVALSIRNRGDSCLGGQGCVYPGDFKGVSSKVSQYNIWDEFLTQISGLTSCFLREDLSGEGVHSTPEASLDFNVDYYKKIRAMYEQNVDEVERILFGSDRDLAKIFPGTPLGDLKRLRHYYHPPAMGKCFPEPRVEYMSGAVARRGDDFALIANTRIKVGRRVEGGYTFREFVLDLGREHDVTSVVDNYPGFAVDARKVSLGSPRSCLPYGVSRSCGFKNVRRYRKAPRWARRGKAQAVRCKVHDRGEDCLGGGRKISVKVGGMCDTQMQPVSGVR
jgi:hypothetical protein